MARKVRRHGGGARRMLSRAHLWFGLTIGLIWSLQGLTGLALHGAYGWHGPGAAPGAQRSMSVFGAHARSALMAGTG